MSEIIKKKRIIRMKIPDEVREEREKERKDLEKRKALYEETLRTVIKKRWDYDEEEGAILDNNCQRCFLQQNWEDCVGLCNECYGEVVCMGEIEYALERRKVNKVEDELTKSVCCRINKEGERCDESVLQDEEYCPRCMGIEMGMYNEDDF